MTDIRRRICRQLGALFAVMAWAAVSISPLAAAPPPLLIENSFLKIEVQGVPHSLQAMFVKETGRRGPLPIALITHGSAGDSIKNRALDSAIFERVARDFARRGWLAAVVIRRGYGQSSKAPVVSADTCASDRAIEGFASETDDLAAALAVIGKRADADAKTAIVLGNSVGGAVALGLAARGPAGLRAVVNVSGGSLTVGEDAGADKAGCDAKKIDAVIAAYGAKNRLPTLWLYAENDSLFSPDKVRALHEAYTVAGGMSDFHLFGPVGSDGHGLFSSTEGILLWLPVLDRFLKANGLKTYDRVPMDAALRALNLGPTAQESALRYFGRSADKALFISASNRGVAITSNGTDLDEEMKAAKDQCEKQTKEVCRPLFVNFDIVQPQ